MPPLQHNAVVKTEASAGAPPLPPTTTAISTKPVARLAVKKEPRPAPATSAALSRVKSPRAGVSNISAKAAKSDGGHDDPIVLDSDSDIEMEEVPSNGPGPEANENPPPEIGPPTLFPAGTTQFPATIDTGFNGNSIQVLKFREIPLERYATTAKGLKTIWPDETPVPEATGGFYEELATYSHGGFKKSKKSRKTQSRVARLAGMIKIHVRIANPDIAHVLSGRLNLAADAYRGRPLPSSYVLADHLWAAIQRCGNPDACVSAQAQETLRAIYKLNDKQNIFKERCLFVVAEAPQEPPSKEQCVAELRFHIYFRRGLFGLAANPNIQRLLDALQPLPHQASWTPNRQCPPSTNVYQQSQSPRAHGFAHSLPGILWANESTGYPLPAPLEEPAYEGVNVTLRDYQRESVAWMRNQENTDVAETGGGVAGLNGYFWEKRTFADGQVYYYFPFGGQILMHSPPVVTGGLLAEEMGLGKTVITLELVCSDAEDVPADRGGTLVVLPVSLLAQWEEEVRTKAPHLRALTYHGDKAREFHSKYRGRIEESIAKFDIVLTTMSKLKELKASRNRGHVQGRLKDNCLAKIEWHRLVVDECQFLKNDTTSIALSAADITANSVWMLSGTPLTNKLDDLRGELALLRVWPFTLGTSSDQGWRDHFWAEYVKKSWDERSGESLPIIHNLMHAVSMRHSRLQLRADGSPLVELPPRTEKFVAITMEMPSSYSYVTRWVEAAAAKLLGGFNRFDVRVSGLIMKLRQLSSSPALLLDQASLEQLDGVLSELANFESDEGNLDIPQVALVEAIKERKNEKDSPVLQELMLVAANGPGCLTPCIYCKMPRTKPVYLSCTHSLCVGCCNELLKFRGGFQCPACSNETRLEDCHEVLIPEQLLSAAASRATTSAIEVDLTAEKIDEVLVDESLQPTTNPEPVSEPPSETLTLTSYDVSHHANFQGQAEVQKSATFASLQSYPKAHAELDLRTQEVIVSLANGGDLKALVKHAAACGAELHTTPKINALVDTIQSIRDSSLEAKICVFSTYARVLDHVEKALDNVRYTIEYDMNTNVNLLTGQLVEVFEYGRKSGRKGHVVGPAKNEDKPQRHQFASDHFYEVKALNGGKLIEHRSNLQAEPVVVADVPSKLVRTNKMDNKLSVNGSLDRHAIGSAVESKRPAVSSNELHVGYAVTILPVTEGGQPGTGRVVYVHQEANGNVSYDVRPDGYVALGDGEHVRTDVLTRVPPTRLLDKGGGGKCIPAKVIEVSTKKRLSDATFAPSDPDSAADPFESAIGYVRLDGSAGNALRRGEILDCFKRDPMTSVCLLTKESAGVGLNLTDANHVIVLEPSIDAHDEIQAIARVHRIGQTRKVQVHKFYMKDSLEERILTRRQQRGELSGSINFMAGGASSSEEDGAKGDNAEVSSSRAMTFEDLKLLLGMAKGEDDGATESGETIVPTL